MSSSLLDEHHGDPKTGLPVVLVASIPFTPSTEANSTFPSSLSEDGGVIEVVGKILEYMVSDKVSPNTSIPLFKKPEPLLNILSVPTNRVQLVVGGVKVRTLSSEWRDVCYPMNTVVTSLFSLPSRSLKENGG